MDYWSITSKGRGERSLTLGTQYRAFSSGIRKHDETKGNEIKGGKEEGKESVKAAISTDGESSEDKKETKEGGGDTSTTPTGVHQDGDVGKDERKEREGGSTDKLERDPPKQEAEQESSEGVKSE